MASAPILDINAYGHEDIEEEKPDYTAILAWLQQEEQSARDTSVDEQRRVAISFYNGDPFGDEEDGRSQVVTRDVAEVVDYMTASVLRTMVSGDRVVEFEALDGDDKDILEEATEAVSQQFMQEQDGFRILHDCLKAGLLEKTGQIKSYVDVEKKRRQREVSVDELVELQQQYELTEAEPLDPEETMWRVAWIEERPKFVDEPLANEEFGCAKDARSVKTSAYYHHKTPKTISDLKEMGFDTDLIGYQDGGYSGATQLERARDGDADTQTIYRDGPMRTVWLLEEYCRYDLNGDGIAEYLRVSRVGTAILNVEEIEYGLVREWCPFPMQHRRIGQSLADKVMDIQRNRSVVLRNDLDARYQSIAPRWLIHEASIGLTTIDDILSPRPAAPLRWKGSVPPTPVQLHHSNDSIQMLEVLAGERESRTGITRLNQGLDTDALSKTASGQAMMQASGQQMEEYVARHFAEFIGDVFELKYQLMKDYGKPFSVIVDGQPKQVDPRQWPDEMRVMVRVGLGSGRKEQRIQHRMTVLEVQKEAMMAGLPNVGPEQIFNSIKGLVADLALGQGTDYFMDPAKMPPQPEKPDPEMLKVQADAQANQQKIQLEAQKSAAQLQQSEAESAAKIQLMHAEADAKLQLEREKAAQEAMLAQQKFEFEAAQAMQKMQFEAELAEKQADRQHEVAMKSADAKISQNRPGGSLSE
jgi:hypothetical protein